MKLDIFKQLITNLTLDMEGGEVMRFCDNGVLQVYKGTLQRIGKWEITNRNGKYYIETSEPIFEGHNETLLSLALGEPSVTGVYLLKEEQ